MDLPDADRASLAVRLLATVDEPAVDDTAEGYEAWLREVERRLAALADGEDRGEDWDVLHRDLVAEFGADELRRLQTAMDRLPPKYRDVVVMRRLDDLSRAEIAVRLGLSEETVTTYLRRGMCALADMLYSGQSSITEGEP